MSKRLDTIRSLFNGSPEAEPSKEAAPGARPRVTAGVVHAIKDTFSAIENENETLRARLTAGDAVVEIDPALIDPSFAQDRMTPFEPEGADADFVSAVKEQGQLVPVLLRERADAQGRYQPAYGRRRIAAAAHLGRKVRAIVRELSDEQLVVAQGQENESRNALTFIERCRFAATLEGQGFSRKVIESALSAPKSTVSEMLQIVSAIPGDIVDWIGPAPAIGRPRWLALVGHLKASQGQKALKRAVFEEKFAAANFSGDRFSYVLSLVTPKRAPAKPLPWTLAGRKAAYGALAVSPRKITLTIDLGVYPASVELALEKIEDLRRALESAALPATLNQEH